MDAVDCPDQTKLLTSLLFSCSLHEQVPPISSTQ